MGWEPLQNNVDWPSVEINNQVTDGDQDRLIIEWQVYWLMSLNSLNLFVGEFYP